MKAVLIRHTHPDHPDWEIVWPHVPLGTVYEVLGFRPRMRMENVQHGVIFVDCYYLAGRNGGRPGFIPVFCFRVDES